MLSRLSFVSKLLTQCRRLVAYVAFFSMFAFIAHAAPTSNYADETHAGSWRLSIGLGPNFNQLDAISNDELKSDIGFGVSVDYFFSPKWFGHLAIDHFEFDDDPSMDSFLGGIGYELDKWGENWYPYIILGAGATQTYNFPGGVDDQTGLTFNIRPGIHYALSPNWYLGLSYEFVTVLLDSPAEDAQVGLPFITFAYWNHQEPTRTRIVREEPRRVRQDRDSDQDGVTDRYDKCPGTPLGKAVDDRGCEEPEDRDSDRDGVADSYDQCANTPRGVEVNGFGCQKQEKIQMRLTINFDSDSAVIKPEYYRQLNKVAVLMRRNPKAKLLIEGHTDSQGSDEYNLDLSNARAQAVREYLVTGGLVKSARVSSKGFGESRPVDTNETESGRLRNRRILATFYY